MGTFWEDVKKTVKQGLSVAAEKTEEYTRIGKIKVDIMGIKKDIDKTYREMGMGVYELLDKKQAAAIAKDKILLELKVKIDNLKQTLKDKEAEIEEIRKENPDMKDVDIEEVKEEKEEEKEEKKEEKPAPKRKATRAKRSQKTK